MLTRFCWRLDTCWECGRQAWTGNTTESWTNKNTLQCWKFTERISFASNTAELWGWWWDHHKWKFTYDGTYAGSTAVGKYILSRYHLLNIFVCCTCGYKNFQVLSTLCRLAFCVDVNIYPSSTVRMVTTQNWNKSFTHIEFCTWEVGSEGLVH